VRGQSIATFNFRTVTDKFNKLVYRYPIRIPERYALVIRSLLTQVLPRCTAKRNVANRHVGVGTGKQKMAP
jgi:hypothetical protein